MLNAIFSINKSAKETRDPMFLEALGAAQLDAGEAAMAMNSFRTALSLTQSPAIGARLSLEIDEASSLIPKPTPQVFEGNPAQPSPQ